MSTKTNYNLLMFRQIKNRFYFLCASYFKFWARIQLRRWHPYIIVVTGSSGKTTLLHLLQSQIGDKARYTHLANSAFGIPFDILDLHRKTFAWTEWLWLFCKAPYALTTPTPKETIYIVEADCDRPGEGSFLATLLQPNLTLWLNTARTHTHNFDKVVTEHTFGSVEEAISHEFGYFLEHTQDIAYLDGDSKVIMAESARSRAKIVAYKEKEWLDAYTVDQSGTRFSIRGKTHTFTDLLLPQETWLSLVMCLQVCQNLAVSYDYSYSRFTLPPGRSSLFQGIKDTILLDSTYNSNYDSMRVMLDLFAKMPATKKWIVLGDMVELGAEEGEEHAKLAQLLREQDREQLILIGPRLQKYTLPLISQKKVMTFLQPKEALVYIQNTLKGGETILFKGSRFLEGILAQVLRNKHDAKLLCRREAVWQKRRAQWGLV